MAKRKPKKKKKPAPKRSKRGIFFFIFFSMLLSATLAGTIYFIFLRPGTEYSTNSAPARKPAVIASQNKFRAAPTADAQQERVYEEPHQVPPALAAHHPKRQITTPPPHGLPRVAIIIDDMGYRLETGRKLIALDLPLSFAFLPASPHATELMNKAHNRLRDILLHLPMEASSNKWDPGPGALFTSMTEQAIIKQVEENLDAVPLAIGANNHMGSKFTQDRIKMAAALQPIKKRSLFFIDSLTISSSVAAQVATEMAIKTSQRDVFLDNEHDVAKIKKQLDLLVERAQKHGTAIGIGHPYGATLSALEKYQYWLKKEVEIVPVHTMTH